VYWLESPEDEYWPIYFESQNDIYWVTDPQDDLWIVNPNTGETWEVIIDPTDPTNYYLIDPTDEYWTPSDPTNPKSPWTRQPQPPFPRPSPPVSDQVHHQLPTVIELLLGNPQIIDENNPDYIVLQRPNIEQGRPPIYIVEQRPTSLGGHPTPNAQKLYIYPQDQYTQPEFCYRWYDQFKWQYACTQVPYYNYHQGYGLQTTPVQGGSTSPVDTVEIDSKSRPEIAKNVANFLTLTNPNPTSKVGKSRAIHQNQQPSEWSWPSGMSKSNGKFYTFT
jgi:hypothetical protein